MKKVGRKLSDVFEAHCVDSFVLANWQVGGHAKPDNKAILYLVPLHFHRRQLHRLQPGKGGVRKRYGGTRSMGFKRGSWVKHPKWGVCYIGGASKGRLSLHSLETGKRLTQRAKPEDCLFLTYAIVIQKKILNREAQTQRVLETLWVLDPKSLSEKL